MRDNLNKLPLILDPSALRDAINSVTDVKDEVPDNFKCNICVQLVHEPEECG